jgi:hypothetical protein
VQAGHLYFDLVLPAWASRRGSRSRDQEIRMPLREGLNEELPRWGSNVYVCMIFAVLMRRSFWTQAGPVNVVAERCGHDPALLPEALC